ncbi:shikimate dehydrogenase [Rhodohalobacter sulfatireducens]|uniref:Shikimate dehydrogenase (NADP(+)) n=1 Tax=Rhodohalobacter sulfatireducens TaxID=2911366 RepID=A0ABS9KG13_9BACT|nr:shikimate dehydrogenase [Rhodohalobacter sulfatireducens]MCG2589782.1 shikimate dehydrogenase [Rhodohalobacter sulfatireducens]
MVLSFRDFKNSAITEKRIYAVVGHPISHSLSPIMHQTALDYYEIDAEYVAIDLPLNQLREFIPWCNHDNFLGCNITIPHKEAFNEIVDEIDPFARDVGVINTLVKRDYKLIGYNTDVYGFLKPLEPYIDDIEHSRAIIFGTGGASKAVKIALESEDFEELIFVSRRPNQRKIESDISEIRVLDYNQWQSFAEEADLFINTTPVGMYPNSEKTFLREGEVELFEGKICYDLIYNPLETIFLKQASEFGAVTINGLDMLIHQGSKSFELWTGHTFPVEKIRNKLMNHLQSDQ